MRPAVALTLAALAALAAPAAGRDEVDEDLQLWNVTTGSVIFDVAPVKLVPYLEVQERFDDDATDLEELQVRTMFLVRFGPGFWAGPGFVWSSLHEPSYTPEYRPYQELGWKLPGKDLEVAPSIRLRLEQRVLHAVDPVSWRLRVRPMFEVPIASVGAMPLALVVWDEVFVNLNDVEEGPREGYQQNRAFAGLSLKLVPEVELQVGYMNQHRNHWGRTDEMGHTLWIQLNLVLEVGGEG